jgi:hypothetical protein
MTAVALTLLAAQACSGAFSTSVADAGTDVGSSSGADATADDGSSPDGSVGHEASAGNDAEPEAGDASMESSPGEGAPESAAPEASLEAASDVHEASGPWMPLSLGSSLVVWLEGDVGTTTAPCGANTCVTAWADQSGTVPPNSAGVGSGGTAPILTPNAFNGHAAVTFDGSTTGTASLAIADATSIEFTGGYSIVVVAFPATSASPHIGELYGKTDSATPFRGPALWVNYANTGIASTTGQAGTQIDALQWAASSETNLDGALAAFSAVYDGSGHLSIRVNNDAPTITVASPSGPLTAVGRVAFVGGAANSGQVLAGSIVEVIVVGVALSTTDWNSTYGYLKSKYQLP